MSYLSIAGGLVSYGRQSTRNISVLSAISLLLNNREFCMFDQGNDAKYQGAHRSKTGSALSTFKWGGDLLIGSPACRVLAARYHLLRQVAPPKAR
jgi:hypothetical protein